jgi:hypothetical protein
MVSLRGVQTGDILYFSTSSNVARGIQLATGSVWNHVSIAVWLETNQNFAIHGEESLPLPSIPSKGGRGKLELYCFETNNNAHVDHLTGRYTSGARLVALNHLISSSNRIAWRSVPIERDGVFLKFLWEFISKRLYYKYPDATWKLLAPLVGAENLKRLPDLTSFLTSKDSTGTETVEEAFCSQLVAEYLQELNLLSREKVSANYSPASLATVDGLGELEMLLDQDQDYWAWVIVIILLLLIIFLILHLVTSHNRGIEVERV